MIEQQQQPAPVKKKKKRGKKKKKKRVYTACMIPDLKPYTQDEYDTLNDEEKYKFMEELWYQNR